MESIIIISSERPSRNNRVVKVARSFKKQLSSLLHLKRPPTSPSIDVGSSSGNHMAVVDAGISSSLEIVPMVTVEPPLTTAVASTEAYTAPSPISVPISASGPAMPGQLGSASSQGLEIPPMHTSPNTHNPISLFQGVHNVYLHQLTTNIANVGVYAIRTKGFLRVPKSPCNDNNNSIYYTVFRP
ncbi:hypothetical protein BYT27DRAFT_7185734 [Phlegmacium glaucopus]|nr:hypothetical protein BYT27DRAFT_7185734 [Phlegmacium glaucopus]